ncbi:MAG: hypothetical protein ACM3L9_02700 [Deltaproteobacteria bacterium]
MTDKPNDKKDQAPADPKRPHATLDLKATELSGGGSKAETSAQPGTDRTTTSSPSKPEPVKPASNSPAARSPSAFTRIVTHLAAGVAGGAIVLFGGERVAQLIGAPTPAAKVEATASELDKRISALEAAPKSDAYDLMKSAEERLGKIDKLAADIENLRSEQTRLAQNTDSLSSTIGSQNGLSVVQDRVAALEDQLKTLAAAASSETGGSRISDIAAITARISEAERGFAGEVSKLRDGIAREIDERLVIREDAGKSDVARLSQSIEKLKADQARLDKSIQAAQEESGRVSSGLDEVKATLDQHSNSFAKPADVTAAVSPVADRVSKIEGNLEGVLSRDSARQTNAERIVTALELGNLRRAIDSGKNFAKELEAVNAASNGSLNLKPLEPFKTSGIPSLAEIRKDSRAALLSALDAASVSDSASVWDRMLASARTIVRIRRTDAAEGDDTVEAIVARMEKSLNAGNLADVLAEIRKLPPETAAKLAPWTEKVVARQSVDEALTTVENELKAALIAPAVPPPAGSKE